MSLSKARSHIFQVGARGVLAAAITVAAAWGGTFGQVVTIGGSASDIALDERRGVLYIANSSAGRIEVMNVSDRSIPRSINVNTNPRSLALSQNSRYLVVSHL